MNRRMFLLLMLAITASTLRAANGNRTELLFDYVTNDNGLSHNTVYDICQDAKGFMWFATATGLNRFDGSMVKQYHYEPNNRRSLPSHTVSCVTATTDGKLFVGTNAGLVQYCPETDDFQRLPLAENPDLYDVKMFRSMEQGFDRELLITTGIGAFVYDYDRGLTQRMDSTIDFYGMVSDGRDSYWAFSRYALFRFNRAKTLIQSWRVSSQLFNSAISTIKVDSRGRLWIGTFDRGIFWFDSDRNAFQQLAICDRLSMQYVRTLEEDAEKDVFWAGTESGLYVFDVRTGNYRHYSQTFDNRRSSINDNAVYTVFRNREGVFFAGTYFGGVNIVRAREAGFHAVFPDHRPNRLQGKAISMMARGPDGKLWMATEDAGVVIFDRDSDTFRHLQRQDDDLHSISTNNVQCLLMDNGVCWAGHFMGGLSQIDLHSGRARRFVHQAGDSQSLQNNFVFSLHFLSQDSILVGTLSGVDLFDKNRGVFSRFRPEIFAGCFIYAIFTAPDGKIWFLTSNRGIYILDRQNPGLISHFEANDGSGLSANSIISYCVDSRNQIWIGTRYGGLLQFEPERQQFVACDPNLLIDHIIYGVVEDDDGFFWISTNKGLSRINFQDQTSVHFNIRHGLSSNQFNYKSYFKDRGLLYFGTVNGLTWFNPRKIFTSQETPSVYFQNLRVLNETVIPNAKGLIQNQIDYCQGLTLKHNQNSFALDFSSINYFKSDVSYQYYLEGFEDDWRPLNNHTSANYTNIAPGKYRFRICAVDMITGAVSLERSLPIIIKTPWYTSWPAYLLYFMAISSLIFYIYRNYRNHQREKMALTVARIEKENLKLLHQHKLNFFTYISHEFKTPLSIIIASCEMLSERNNSAEQELHQTIRRSAQRLLSLVSQLMEFRKIETDHADIHIIKGNVIDFSNQVINAHSPLLEKKNIALNRNVSYTEANLYFDFDKLEKILTNLLTNAIKYTPPGGAIDFGLSLDPGEIRLSIKDSGGGISEKKKDKIFEVFYSDNLDNDVVESSGIGLALTASLVKLLKGEITVHSEPGKGSEFIVKLPYEENASRVAAAFLEKNSQTDAKPATLPPIQPDDDVTLDLEPAADNHKPFRLVIAEDNKDLLNLLHRHFKEKYRTKSFENGREAWEYIRQKTPDLVIADVMMPLMSGIELCRKIKSDVNLCHIPLIMLTAKDAKSAKLEGLQAGADAYLTKPFSILELEIRLTNILNNQKALKKRLNELARFQGFDLPVTNHDQAFVEKILAVIQNNMEKNELDVQFIANELKINRSTLHSKMKTLLGMNTSEFINTVRIHKAKELIRQSELTFSEIAWKVGYNDSAYFTRMFKKHTQQTPGEYRKSLKVN